MIIFEEQFRAKGIDTKAGRNNWMNFLKVVISTDFFKLLTDYPVEVIDPKKIRALEKYFDDKLTNQAEIQKSSRALSRLITWARGNIIIYLFLKCVLAYLNKIKEG